ncbi:MAG: methyltransferase domain-containing protein [Candidatus Obscuribacterales bacterium]|nr:methyltransferase domain-containing protein [Steroidobacteraceae bacterium]
MLGATKTLDIRYTLSDVDPTVPDWPNVQLPDAWPDRLNFLRAGDWLRLLRAIAGRPKRAEIPVELPGYEFLPKYLIQEFHGLPNGNFSKRITRGYISGFDRIMLGRMRRARQHIVAALQRCSSVLDVGCGGGQTAGLLEQAGATDVWGLDPSPYLLQHAARDYPQVRFVQGLAEDLHFADQRFDGVVACFVLHEMPPRVATQALREFHRVLKPGGRLTLCEPSATQLQLSYWELLRRYGLAGIYFRLLAQRVYEPFVAAWHKQDAVALLKAAGFDVIADEHHLPVRHLLAVRAK